MNNTGDKRERHYCDIENSFCGMPGLKGLEMAIIGLVND